MAAYDTGTPSVEDQAKAWVDAVNSATGPSGGWRLQFVRMRTRRKFGKPLCGDAESTLPPPDPGVTDADGDPVASAESFPTEDAPCPEAPVRIRRFVSGCPWALVDQAIRYLHRIAPYRGIVYNGVRLPGAYRPTVTQWMRDEQSQSPGERGSLGTYTLVQDLVEITCCGDEETLGTGDSCQSSEETTYVWDADSVEPLPTACEQGVAYALRAVQRDEEGNFSYQLVRSVAKTVAWGPVTISCGPLETVEEWGWRNLYGCPGSFRADKCYTACPSSKGLDTIPAEGRCDTAEGVRTEAQWQLNQDCTWDVRVRRRTARPQEGGWEDGTSCRGVSHVRYRNSPDVPYVDPPAPGERVSANFQLNDDMTWDGEVSRVAAPEPLEYGWTEGSACRERAVEVYEDQVDRPVPPDVSSLAPGETLEASVSRTEDCLWNARFVRTAAPEAEEMVWNEGSSCQSVESHRLVNQRSYDGIVPAPGPGERVSADVSRNPDCTYDVSYRVQKPYEGADVEWEDGTGCQVRRHTLWIDRAEKPVVGSAGPGETVSASLRFDPSSCTWSGERVVTAAPEADHMRWTEGSSCQSVESHRLVNQRSYDGIVPAPAKGERVSADVSRNPDCTYDVSYRVQKPYEGADVEWEDGTGCQVRRHTLWIDKAEKPVVGSAGPGETVSASLRFDPSSCTWSGERVVTAAPEADHMRWTEGSSCQSVESHRLVNQRSYDGIVPAPGPGERVSADVSRNPDCTYDVSYRVQKPYEGADVEWDDGTGCQVRRHTLWIDRAEKPEIGSAGPGETVSASLRFDPSSCTWSGERVVTAAPEADHMRWTEGSSCQPVESHRLVNQPSYDGIVPAPAKGERVSADVSRNPDCTYDVRYSVASAYEGGAELSWDDGPKCRRTHHLQIVGAREKPSAPTLDPGQTLSMNLRFDPSDCTWSGEQAVTDPMPPEELRWDEGTCMVPAESVALLNQATFDRGAIPSPDGTQSVQAQVRRNSDCTYDVSYTVRRAEPKDTDWITWDSETVTGRGTSKYHHGYRAFFNLDEVPRPDRGSNVSMSVRLNEFCKYDGEISYSDLYEWTGGGSEGGIRTRTTAVFAGVTRAVNPRKRTTYVDAVMWKIVETRIFLGSGNEGSEAEFELDGGVHVHGRTYRKESTLVVPVTVRGGLPGGHVDLSGVPEDTLDAIQRYVDKAGRIGLR